MKILSFFILHISFFMLTLSASGAVSLNSMPYVFYGRIVDWQHQAYASDSDVVLRAYNSSDELIAKTAAFTASGKSTVNYRLEIPIASTKTSGYATVGETLRITIFDGDTDYSTAISSGTITVGASGGTERLNLMLAEDTNADGVADQYANYYAYLAGKSAWDSAADWDGDGVSNYDEYCAGTNPCLASDYFRVNKLPDGESEDDYFCIEVLAAPGRTYSIRKSDTLADAAVWTLFPFCTEKSGAEVKGVTSGSTSEIKRFYLPKDKNKTTQFYKVVVE